MTGRGIDRSWRSWLAFRSERAAHRVRASGAGLFVTTLLLAGLGHRELYSSHEARAAQNAQRMLDTGEWGIPVLFDGRIDLQKPPAYYWAVAVVGWLNGGQVTEWVVRLPAALAGLLAVGLVYGHLRREGRPTAAVISALALATACHFTAIARTARVDVPLTSIILVSLLAFVRGCRNSSIAWHLISGSAAGLAVLLKGPVALALVGPTAVVWFVVERRFGSVRLPLASVVLGPLVVAALAGPWFFWADRVTDGEFLRVFFWHHTVARFTGSSPLLAQHPTWYYLPRLAIDFLPWTPLLLGLLFWAARTGQWTRDPAFRLGAISATVTVLVLSAAKFKRADYLLPAYPGLALALGTAAEAWLAARRERLTVRRAKTVFLGLLGLVVVGWLVMFFIVEPATAGKETKRAFARVIRTHAPAPHLVLQFRYESHLLSFHLGRPVRTLVEWGELNDLLTGPGPHFVVMPREYVFAAQEICTGRRLVEIARLSDFTTEEPERELVFLRAE